jgi:hypothetical protein
MTDNDYNRILSAAKEFAERTAKNMPYKDMIAEVYRNGAILEHNHLCEWHKATEEQPEVGKRVLCKLNNGSIYLGCYSADRIWYLKDTCLSPYKEYLSWRYIID